MTIKSLFWSLLLLALFACRGSENDADKIQAGTKTGIRSDTIEKLEAIVNRTMITHNDSALRYSRVALKLANATGETRSLIKANLMIGLTYSGSYRDSAFFYYNMALAEATRQNDTLLLAQILYNLGAIYYFARNYPDAIMVADSAILLASASGQYKVLADGYNLLGNIHLDSRNFDMSRRMYDSSLHIALRHSFYRQAGVALGNLSKFDTELDTAMVKLRAALNYLSREPGTEREMALYCNNIASRHTNSDTIYDYSRRALELTGNRIIPEVEMGAYNNLAYIYLEWKDYQKAEECLTRHAIPVAEKQQDHDWLASLYDTYADVLAAKGNLVKALEYEKLAIGARETADNELASEQLRLLSTILDVKNKEEQIRKSNEELEAKRNYVRVVNLLLLLSVVLIIGLILAASWILTRRRLKYQQQLNQTARRIIALEEGEKARVSMELHDLIGPMIMSIRRQMEDMEIADPDLKKELSDKLLALGGRLRSLSHRMNLVLQQDHSFNELIIGLCSDMKALTDIPIHLDLPANDPDLNREQIAQIYRIIQELLTNAIKYVKEGSVDISVTAEQDRLFIFYDDTGPGFERTENGVSSMGILNIFERATFLGGKASLNSATGKGTHWSINLPLKTL